MTVKLFEENLKVGDWVKGKSRNGELIYGYIQTINPSKKAALINVVKSDDEKMVGTTIGMMDGKIEKLPLQKTAHEEQILSLIDLALLTKDEAWFIELTAELKRVQDKKQG
ncbi:MULTISPECIES: IDEAL domain-containing protein [Priestia]|uniref:IDEAL domain-containing protein n=1 Tax=Priestia TaxID=2800373 RepID=UPI001CCD0655|nr:MULTISPECIES: IDEAL domain-containing protein [Priestia]MDH3114371.1 IDEAL domain-containing protein [Priestia aryabhattai]MDH3133025.1 IDEAL domain-containing protein [Priestia aryabhattai]MED3897499.1 IDEAL domain-containing protein [Priestia aryabhattai]MED4156511.1 IDEAL domain-containing protein [Priestia aryabhattai]